MEQPPTCEDCGVDAPLTIKHILTECPSLNNKIHQFFGTTNKTMKQLLNNGDTTYGCALYKFVTNIDLLTKLYATIKSILIVNSNLKYIEKHFDNHNLLL